MLNHEDFLLNSFVKLVPLGIWGSYHMEDHLPINMDLIRKN